jgi:hypothetical protein
VGTAQAKTGFGGSRGDADTSSGSKGQTRRYADPPQPDALELLEATHRRSRLTLRVYAITADGTVADDCGKLVEIVADGRTEPLPRASAYPSCACP